MKYVISINRINRSWKVNNKLHREGDYPASEFTDGYKSWYKEGKRHRLNGPAVIYSSGAEAYWIDGMRYLKEKFNEICNKNK